jgi:hypothetical protein
MQQCEVATWRIDCAFSAEPTCNCFFEPSEWRRFAVGRHSDRRRHKDAQIPARSLSKYHQHGGKREPAGVWP